jgi:hypothetical protein
MNLSFLKNQPATSINNVVLIYKDVNSSKPDISFHPFIESFKHVLTPKISEEEFGLFAVTTYYRNGVAKNTYQIGLTLPAVDDAHAKKNFEAVQALKRLADPEIKELQGETGQVKLRVGKLIPLESQIGYIMAVDETMEVDQGFSKEGYPKLIRLNFTFAVDEIRRALLERPAPPAVAVKNNPTPTKPAGSTGEQAQKSKRKKGAGGDKTKPTPQKQPC